MIGKRLSHYRIAEQIGRGGMGVVYRAHDEQLDRDVAIKVLPHGSLSDEAARKRFRTEALSLARLNHPNVVVVYDVGTIHDQVFVAMELVPGPTLAEWIAKGPHRWQEVVDVFVQAGHGLAAAQRRPRCR